MTLAQSIAYGLVQGLGEFLPISSSAHLVLLPWVAGWQDPGLAVDVALHVGTLVALLWYFRVELWGMARALAAIAIERRIGDAPERRLAVLVAIGSVPGALVGAALEHKAEDAFRAPWLIAITLMTLGLILYLADRAAPQRRSGADLTLRDALLVGCAQACAIVPGISRSGSTITAARLLGLDRESSARFSFLLAVPITAGAAFLKLVVKHKQFVAAGGMSPEVLVATAVAGVSGYLAIAVLLRYLRASSFLPFAVYRLLVGAGVLALYFARGT
jgi:undecaprenyl-diphosphatase